MWRSYYFTPSEPKFSNAIGQRPEQSASVGGGGPAFPRLRLRRYCLGLGLGLPGFGLPGLGRLGLGGLFLGGLRLGRLGLGLGGLLLGRLRLRLGRLGFGLVLFCRSERLLRNLNNRNSDNRNLGGRRERRDGRLGIPKSNVTSRFPVG